MLNRAWFIISVLAYAGTASAGIIVDSSQGSIIGPFSALLISSAGFFFRGPRRGSPLLYLKESNLQNSTILNLLKKNYPDLPENIAQNLANKIIEKNEKTPYKGKIKEIIFDSSELDECLIDLKNHNQELFQNISNDLNKKTIL